MCYKMDRPEFIWFLEFCYLHLKSFEELYRHYSPHDFRVTRKSYEVESVKSLSLEKAHSKNKRHITQFSEVTSLGQQQVRSIPVSLTLGCIKQGNAVLRTDNFLFPGTKAQPPPWNLWRAANFANPLTIWKPHLLGHIWLTYEHFINRNITYGWHLL